MRVEINEIENKNNRETKLTSFQFDQEKNKT